MDNDVEHARENTTTANELARPVVMPGVSLAQQLLGFDGSRFLTGDGTDMAESRGDQLTTSHPDFASFIEALIDEQDYDGAQVRMVLNEPWHWDEEFADFLARERGEA